MNECPVCYEELSKNDQLACGHYVHGHCVISSGKAQCPLCRSELPEYKEKVVNLVWEPQEWGLLDKLVAMGWLSHMDIPIIDELGIPAGDNLKLVKATVLLYSLKDILISVGA